MMIKDEYKCPVFKYMPEEKCSGCEVCVDSCPVGALSMQEKGFGFLYPVLDDSKCIDCNKCVRVCPINNTIPRINTLEKYYGASNVNEKILLQSASGGIFTFLVEEFRKCFSNGIVVGAIYEDGFKRIIHFLSNQEEDIWKMRGSKYFQSSKNGIYKKVKKKLDLGEAVFFTGTPCEVAALYFHLEGKEYKNLWTMDFICKGTSSPKILKDYINFYARKMRSDVVYMNMRYKWSKLDSWIPQFIMMKFENGRKLFKEFYNTELGMGFQILQRDSCHSCPYREQKHLADFTIGDLHGANKEDKIYNPLGVSAIIINSEKGNQLWKDFDMSKLKLKQIIKEDIYGKNRNSIDSRSELMKFNLEHYDSVIAVRKTIGIKEKIKMRMPVMLLRKITSWRRECKK